MPFTFSPSSKPSRAGARSAYDRQVSANGRRLLLFLVRQQRAMTSRAARLELANQGIPWRPAEAAEALELLPPSVARTLAALEARRLVFCWATGEGRGRRVSHIKLTHAAERLADEQERYGMSQQQRSRQHAAEYRARREAAELAEMEERWPTPEAEAWTDEPYATGGRT